MFQEEEVGKPKRWGCLVAVMVTVTIFNLSVVILIRALLDSEDEINEPIIQGRLRDDLTFFLGIFTMTFFFGCYCCFCCGCYCCKWVFYDFPLKLSSTWQTFTNYLIFYKPTVRRRFSNEASDIEQGDVVNEARGVTTFQMTQQESDHQAYEASPRDTEIEPKKNASNLILPPNSTRK